jgi:hypothetical protein
LRETATLLNIDAHSKEPENQKLMQELFDTALAIKQNIYGARGHPLPLLVKQSVILTAGTSSGNRIVLFAPLYLANYCVNSCTYCAFRGANSHIARSSLTKEELIQVRMPSVCTRMGVSVRYQPSRSLNARCPHCIVQEVQVLEKQGHRRLLILTGEHPKYTFDQFLDALQTVKSVKTGASSPRVLLFAPSPASSLTILAMCRPMRRHQANQRRDPCSLRL